MNDDTILTVLFKLIFIYPSYFVYKCFSGIYLLIKRLFTFDSNTEIDKKLFESDIDINSALDDNLESEDINYYTNEVADKYSHCISDLSSKLSEKKKCIEKLDLAKELLDEINEEGVSYHNVKGKKYSWRYEALNYEGQTVRGYFKAYSKIDAISFLADENLVVYKIKVDKFAITLNNKPQKIKNKDLIFIVTQLSTYLKSGIALSDAIGILIRQTRNANQKKVLYNLKYELMLGESLSSAMIHQGRAFPMILINMVKSAELTGELPEVLDDMAEYFTEIEETRKQMISALTYPTLVMVFTLFVIVFVMMYVVPKFVDIYDTMEDAKIPAFTQGVINISLFIENNILWILLALILILLVVVYLYKKVKVCRKIMQYVMMKMPVIGNIIIYNEVAIFSKTFASLLKHNVFITESMDILNKITNNEIYRSMISNTIVNLSKGDKISTAFQNQWSFPIPAYEMILTGEKTGQLAEMMDKVSRYYQSLHRSAVARVKALIEPIIIILLTFGVGAVLLAVVIPMFNMYETVQQMEG